MTTNTELVAKVSQLIETFDAKAAEIDARLLDVMSVNKKDSIKQFVDPVNGDDSLDGLTEATAIQTLNRAGERVAQGGYLEIVFLNDYDLAVMPGVTFNNIKLTLSGSGYDFDNRIAPLWIKNSSANQNRITFAGGCDIYIGLINLRGVTNSSAVGHYSKLFKVTLGVTSFWFGGWVHDIKIELLDELVHVEGGLCHMFFRFCHFSSTAAEAQDVFAGSSVIASYDNCTFNNVNATESKVIGLKSASAA